MFWRKSKSEAALQASQAANNVLNHRRDGSRNAEQVSSIAESARDTALQADRKSLISIYILCRVLMEVVKQTPPETLGEDLSEKLEEIVFKQLRMTNPVMIASSVIRAANWNLFAEVLGAMSYSRFASVGDRFIADLEKVNASTGTAASKDIVNIQLVIHGMRYLQLKLYPMDSLEESAEFLESLSKFFARSHGQTIKLAYAEVLNQILMPIAGVATAELNHPIWVKSVGSLYAKATEMMAKPKYWLKVFPLATTVLCVSPQEMFSKHWLPLFENNLSKFKDRGNRNVFVISIARLVWVFMFRCTETLNNTTKKLDIVFRPFLAISGGSSSKKILLYSDSQLQVPLIYLLRQVGYGYLQYVLEHVLFQLLLNGSSSSSLMANNTSAITLEAIAPDRAMVAIKAYIAILADIEAGERPVFPIDDVLEAAKDRQSPLEAPSSLKTQTELLHEFHDKFGKVLGRLLFLCDSQISSNDDNSNGGGSISVTTRPMLAFHFGSENSIQTQKQTTLDLFICIIEAIPWCLPSNLAFSRVVELLCRNVLHPDPRVSRTCCKVLKNLTKIRDPKSIIPILTKLIFSVDEKIYSSCDIPTSWSQDFEKLMRLYVELVEIWIASASSGASSTTSLWTIVEEIEGNGLFFLCSQDRAVRQYAIKILRLTADFDNAVAGAESHRNDGNKEADSRLVNTVAPSRLIHLLEHADIYALFKSSTPPINLSMPERSRLSKLHGRKRESLVWMAESDSGVDTALWLKMFPSIMKLCFDKYPIPVALCRNIICVRLVQMHDAVLEFVDNSPAFGNSSSHHFALKHPMRTHGEILVEQWRMYLIVVCATVTLTDEQKLHVPDNQYQHGRKKSVQKVTIHHQKITSARSVFRMVIPLLGVDHPVVRDAIVTGLGCVNINIYKTLLECFQPAITSWREEVVKPRTVLKPQGAGPAQRRDSNTRIRQERMATEITHVLQTTSHFLSEPIVYNDESILAQLASFLADMKKFLQLPEVQIDGDFNKLRSLFAGFLENLYLGTRRSTTIVKPVITFQARVDYFTLLEEWCGIGQYWALAKEREAIMKQTLLKRTKEPRDHSIVMASLEIESRSLQRSAVCSMAALCSGPVVSNDLSPSSNPATFNIPGLLKWIHAVLDNKNNESLHELGRSALENLLQTNPDQPVIFNDAIANCYREHTDPKTSQNYFMTVANILLEDSDYPCEVRQPLVLGLYKTGDLNPEVRSLAAKLLKATETRFYGSSCLDEYEVSISSQTMAVYKRAMFNLSSRFAKDHAEDSFMVFSELTMFFHQVDDMSRRDILAVLLPWVQTIELQLDHNGEDPSPSATMVMNNLFEITVVFSGRIQNEVEALWVALGNGRYPGNVKAVLDFILHHSLERRDPEFVEHARKILVYLSATPAGQSLVESLLAFLEPKCMIPLHPEPHDLTIAESQYPYVANLWILLPPHAKEAGFSHGQLAMILLVDLMVVPVECIKNNLALVLNVAFVLLDHYLPIVHEQSREMLVCLVHELGSPASIDSSSDSNPPTPSSFISSLRKERTWYYDDLNSDKNGARTPKAMVHMIQDVLSMYKDDFPDLRETWARVALSWATTCPVRHIACRSFQIFRCLLFFLDQNILADMLARLSNTICDSTADIQGFAMQILMTLNAVTAELPPEELIKFPQLFWATVACLKTVHEQEFIEVLSILEKSISKIDLNSPDKVSFLISAFPPKWEGKFEGLQQIVITGLRSSVSWDQTLRVLDKINKIIPENDLVAGPNRLVIGILANMPRYLHALEMDNITLEIEASAESLIILCDMEQRTNLSRILTSFCKKRFRTKKDFLGQTISAIQQNFFPYWEGQSLVLLLSLLSNKIRWVKEEVLDILELMLPMVDMQREEFAGIGADLISPLLRLLQTDYAEKALEVLDRAVSISGSNMDKHVLRMSLGNRALRKEYERTATLFGIPDESGWAIPMPAVTTAQTRANVHAVFYTCAISNAEQQPNVSDEFEFHMDEYGYGNTFGDRTDTLSLAEEPEGSLGHMWAALDNLDTFFTRGMSGRTQNHGYFNGRRYSRGMHKTNHSHSHTQSLHSHNVSATDTDMSLDPTDMTDAADATESVPQLYDKKVSVILNRSLARTPSTTSFKTSLADSFGNSPTSPIFSQFRNYSQSGGSSSSTLFRRREIVDFSRSEVPESSSDDGHDDTATDRIRGGISSSGSSLRGVEGISDYSQHADIALRGSAYHEASESVGNGMDHLRGLHDSKTPTSPTANESTFRLESLLKTASSIGKKKGPKTPKSSKTSKTSKPREGSSSSGNYLDSRASPTSSPSTNQKYNRYPSPFENSYGERHREDKPYQFPAR